MPPTTQDSAMMICYRECLSNVEKFNGDGEQKAVQFISNIERIGKMIEANDDILYCMCTAKLDGEAKRWYDNNVKLTRWENLKPALLERFTVSDSSSKTFEQLKERKQKPDETVTSYYDAIMQLCHEYDSSMSQKMMLSWLENGIKDSLKIPIKRQMKLLSETARTTHTFLKTARDEQELQEGNLLESEPTSTFTPYFANTVSTTLKKNENIRSNAYEHSHPLRTTTSRESKNVYQQRSDFTDKQRPPPRLHLPSLRQNSIIIKPNLSTFRPDTQHAQPENFKSFNSSNTSTRQFKPCFICKRNNHRTIDCNYKKPNGCFKCGHSDHRIRDCPQVFY
jgi:hypothetical protein